MDHEADERIMKKAIEIIEDGLKSSAEPQRISANNFDISRLENDEKKGIAAELIRKLQIDGEHLDWNSEMVTGTVFFLAFLRKVLLAVNDAELFYYAIGIFFDRLSSSEWYQTGRDIAEEILISSYNDNFPELGYFNSFRFYSNTGHIHAGLMYANLSMTAMLQKKPPYPEKYIKEMVWQGVKFFRNVQLHPWAIQIYNAKPKHLKFSGYERRSLDHSYFLSLLSTKNPGLPGILLDYLQREREEIFSQGIHEATPWLITLYNVDRLYPDADFSSAGLGYFLNVFEMIVPAHSIKKQKDIIYADTSDIKKHLMESLVKLRQTRNTADFVYDNETAIRISSRLIQYGSRSNDAPAFLLSMVLKSDFSILFRSKVSEELAPLNLPDININNLEMLYENTVSFLKALPISYSAAMVWLATSDEQLHELHLYKGGFTFPTLSNWSPNTYKNLAQQEYFATLGFKTTVIDGKTTKSVFPEEFEAEGEQIAKDLRVAQIFIDENADELYIVKDMELSKFPHNLFLSQAGHFIARKIPVTNVLSTEWLLQTNNTKIPADYGKAIWIPIESGDIELNYLYNYIEAPLLKYSFQIFKEAKLGTPLSAYLNIVCSHGAKDIAETQIIFQDGVPTYSLAPVIGAGKILIFFVCHSGSMNMEFFRNSITSMVKRFIAQGYEAVIAPFWALEVTVPGYWLPEFLESMNKGLTISRAVFNANKKVDERYPTPAAWACLHLYGNPNLKIVI